MASCNNWSLAESEIRAALRAQLLATAEAGALVRAEMPVSSARVDLARIGPKLEGFEIKSDSDTLDRLPRQVAAFSSLFDLMTLVVGVSHVSQAAVAVPYWWGVVLAAANADGSVRFYNTRACRPNPAQSGIALAELLWRAEAAEALHELAGVRAAKGWTSKQVRERLAESASVDSIRKFAIERIRNPLRLEEWQASKALADAKSGPRPSSFLLAADRGRSARDVVCSHLRSVTPKS